MCQVASLRCDIRLGSSSRYAKVSYSTVVCCNPECPSAALEGEYSSTFTFRLIGLVSVPKDLAHANLLYGSRECNSMSDRTFDIESLVAFSPRPRRLSPDLRLNLSHLKATVMHAAQIPNGGRSQYSF